ncbi:MAG: HDOD domain-containing protein [Planctomycetales bacterium]|nr:HDOD domain-containing protein [Planctomycetales bacterium]
MLPAVAMQALEIAKCPDCTIDEFSALVVRDVKLSVDMLRMANSVICGGRRSISSIREAVIRLGFRQCRNLILSSSMASLMNRTGKEERSIRETLQHHSFLTATLSAHLNRMFDLGFGGEEFTAGLIHDIGRIVLAVSVPRQTSPADAPTFDESEETLAREEEAFGINHCELGAWYATENRIPEELVEVVRFHHQPHLASKNFVLTALVSLSDHMANHLQRFGNLDDYQPDSNHALTILEAYATLDLKANLVSITRPIIEAATHESIELMAACAG